MRVLVDVTHPAHAHLFRNAIGTFRERGDAVRVASREKDVTTDLLDAYDVSHVCLSRKRAGRLGTVREWAGRELRLLRLARSFDPDVVLSRLNPASAHVSRFLGVPNVVLHDTEVAGVLDRVTTPLAAVVCTPEAYDGDFRAPHVRYRGFHELAYLHPARFTPDPDALRDAGVDPDDQYAVVRLVDMTAHHDAGRDGLGGDRAHRLVDGLADHGDVYVTSEGALPDALDSYGVPVPTDAMHDLLAYADVYVGDSSTMATEAGVLGTPAVRYDPLDSRMGNFEALADYGLVETTWDPDEAVETALALAADPDAGRRWRRRRRRLLAENVDVTAFLVELVTEVATGDADAPAPETGVVGG